MRLAEMYNVHVIDYTHGERGLGEARYLDGSCNRCVPWHGSSRQGHF